VPRFFSLFTFLYFVAFEFEQSSLLFYLFQFILFTKEENVNLLAALCEFVLTDKKMLKMKEIALFM